MKDAFLETFVPGLAFALGLAFTIVCLGASLGIAIRVVRILSGL